MDLSFVCYKTFLCCHNVFLVTHIILAICKPRLELEMELELELMLQTPLFPVP